MSRRTGPQVPRDRVFVPDSPFMGGAHLRDALGVSRAVLHLWRRHYGFPAGHRDGRDHYSRTDDVREWLEGRGVTVTIVQ